MLFVNGSEFQKNYCDYCPYNGFCTIREKEICYNICVERERNSSKNDLQQI